MIGFAFVQFENVFHAANAIKELNMTEIMSKSSKKFYHTSL